MVAELDRRPFRLACFTHSYIRLLAVAALMVIPCVRLGAQDPREIVRRSIQLDQANWLRMKDYTWIARETERQLDSKGQVKSQDSKAWETVILYGEPHRRMLERDGKPLSSAGTTKAAAEVWIRPSPSWSARRPRKRQRRQDEFEKNDRRTASSCERSPTCTISGWTAKKQSDGHDAWVISAVPRLDYQPNHSDAKALLKIRGKLWVDKAEYQWVRLQAETTGTISYGFFLARLNPGAKLFFEQTASTTKCGCPSAKWRAGPGGSDC